MADRGNPQKKAKRAIKPSLAVDLSRNRHEAFKAQGQSVSIGEVLGAIWQMYGAAMEPLQGFEHRAIVLREQALGYMEPIVGIDADQVGIKGGMMDLRQRGAIGTTGWPNRSSLSATMWAASISRGSGSPDNAQRPL